MNADAFRHFFDYHFNENRTIWDKYVSQLSDEQFTEAVSYSHGSVRNQMVHIMDVDDAWFSDLRGVKIRDELDPVTVDRKKIRAHWDGVEQAMRDYLSKLRDETLLEKPLKGEDKELAVWQVLLQVANHGTDHRAQVLRLLKDLGLKTTSQDYVFYAYDHPVLEPTS